MRNQCGYDTRYTAHSVSRNAACGPRGPHAAPPASLPLHCRVVHRIRITRTRLPIHPLHLASPACALSDSSVTHRRGACRASTFRL